MKPLVQLAAVTPRDVSLGTWLKLLFKQMNKCCFTLKEIHAGGKVQKNQKKGAMNLNVVNVVCRLHVFKGAFAYLLLHRLEFLVIRSQVDQHGALAGAVERQVWVCTYEQIFARELKMFNSTKIGLKR